MPRRLHGSVPGRTVTRVAALAAAATLLASCSSAADLAGDSSPSPSGSASPTDATVSGSPAPSGESPTAGADDSAPDGASGSATGSATGTPTGSTGAAASPQAGACRAITVDDLTTVVDHTRPVSCRKTHTAVTFYVGELPPSAVRGAVSSGDDRIEQAAEEACARRFPGYVGGSGRDRALTMLQPAYFLPDAEQFRAGARWVRCDVYAHASADKLAELAGDMHKALDAPKVRDSYATCSTKAPDQRGFVHSLCRDPHNWRAVATLRLAKGKAPFPGKEALQAKAKKDCEKPVRDWLNTREAFAYGFEVPRKSGWAQGERIGYCWAKTTT